MFGSGDDPYKATVSDLLLGAEKYRKCQMVFMPSFAKENAVYILQDGESQETKAKVVWTEMKQPLWSAMMKFLRDEAGGGSFSVAPKAMRRALTHISHEVSRTEAELDAGTVNLLERTGGRILSRVRYHVKNGDGTDGEPFHVAHFVRGIGYRSGKTWSPLNGTRTYDFVELAKVLGTFTHTEGPEREAAHRDMVARAKSLLGRLGKDK